MSCDIIVFISLFRGKLRKRCAADLSFVPVLLETQKNERYFVVTLKILVSLHNESVHYYVLIINLVELQHPSMVWEA